MSFQFELQLKKGASFLPEHVHKFLACLNSHKWRGYPPRTAMVVRVSHLAELTLQITFEVRYEGWLLPTGDQPYERRDFKTLPPLEEMN